MRITDGLKELSRRPYEVVSGKVVGGSIDSDANTMSVVLSANGLEIKDVLLKATSNGEDGVIAIPEDGSDVVIGSYPFYEENDKGTCLVATARDESRLADVTKQLQVLIDSKS